jgi:Yip1 domain
VIPTDSFAATPFTVANRVKVPDRVNGLRQIFTPGADVVNWCQAHGTICVPKAGTHLVESIGPRHVDPVYLTRRDCPGNGDCVTVVDRRGARRHGEVDLDRLDRDLLITLVRAAGRVAAYVLALLSLFAVSRVISLLGPGFGGQRNDVQALKAAAYASTAAWVGGVARILPALSMVSLLFSLYSLVLLYVGLPIVMKVPKDRAMGYTAVVIIAWIVVFLIAGAIVTAF